jgi:hypothetical protein
MDTDLVFVTGDGRNFLMAASWALAHSRPLIVIDTSPDMTLSGLPDGLSLTLLRVGKAGLFSVLNRTWEYLTGPWVFLVGDDQLKLLDDVDYLARAARDIPRLASLAPSRQVGLNQVEVNPLLGTLYNYYLMRDIAYRWDHYGDLSFTEVHFCWARGVSDLGWAHFTAYCPGKGGPGPDQGVVGDGVTRELAQ